MKEIHILCEVKTSSPIRIKLKGRNPQVAFTNIMLAEKYIEAKKATELIRPINVHELELTDNMGIIIEDKDSAIKLLTDPENFESEKYYKQLNKT